ncbi:LppX_LprAFG lipoprotein [Pseudonocardia nigra]|uniref:LppX_LprAFG lipoprotein n=1 Tax=Pseudonocardia nigra TaxID=1921578 RepID=UPI001C5CEA48|nr:LppX_LprAFG lipoprotein [Pseudonocardia nigra]
MRNVRWLQIGVGLAAAALVAGCGGATPEVGTPVTADSNQAATTPTGGDPLQTVVAASEATKAAGTARFEMSLEASQDGQTLTTTATGSQDFAQQLTEMDFTVSVPGTPPQSMRMITAGTTMYQQLPGEERWFSMDLAALAAAGGGSFDPAQQLAMFEKAAKDVREVGPAEVRGVQTRHFELTLDAQAMVDATGGAATQSITEPLPADVYIDGDGRLTRFEMEAKQAGLPSTSISMDLFDFGAPVSIQVPDSALVDSAPAGPPN